MFVLGANLIGGPQSAAFMPTDVRDIDSVTLKNGMYDDLYLASKLIPPTDEIPEGFDFDTALHAKFEGNTLAGNCDWDPKELTHVIVKRRRTDGFEWQTIAVQEVRTKDDYNISGIDYLNQAGVEYEYAVVPVGNGMVEGSYYTDTVLSELDGIFLVERDRIVGTDVSDGSCDTTRNFPGAYVETIHGRYPVAVDTTAANYDTGGFQGMFVTRTEDGCDYEFDGSDYERTAFQRDVMDFLSDRRPKALKHYDGRMWLVKIDSGATDTADDAYNARYIDFEWTEIGDYRSEADLYYTGLSDITEEWWN